MAIGLSAARPARQQHAPRGEGLRLPTRQCPCPALRCAPGSVEATTVRVKLPRPHLQGQGGEARGVGRGSHVALHCARGRPPRLAAGTGGARTGLGCLTQQSTSCLLSLGTCVHPGTRGRQLSASRAHRSGAATGHSAAAPPAAANKARRSAPEDAAAVVAAPRAQRRQQLGVARGHQAGQPRGAVVGAGQHGAVRRVDGEQGVEGGGAEQHVHLAARGRRERVKLHQNSRAGGAGRRPEPQPAVWCGGGAPEGQPLQRRPPCSRSQRRTLSRPCAE